MWKSKNVWVVLGILALLIGGCSMDSVPSLGGDEPSPYRWMSMRLPWVGDSMLAAISRAHTKPSEDPEIDLRQAGGYVLYVAFGSNKYNCYAVLRVQSDGKAIACYQDPSTMRVRQKSFTVQKEVMQRLRTILVKNHAGSLDASYVDIKITDGTQAGLTLLTKNGIRRTYFSNYWPSEFRTIATFLQDQVLLYPNKDGDDGYAVMARNIITDDPEATNAVRARLDD